MHCNSPRASDGEDVGASTECREPALTSMWTSSIKRMASLDFSSSMTRFRRSLELAAL